MLILVTIFWVKCTRFNKWKTILTKFPRQNLLFTFNSINYKIKYSIKARHICSLCLHLSAETCKHDAESARKTILDEPTRYLFTSEFEYRLFLLSRLRLKYRPVKNSKRLTLNLHCDISQRISIRNTHESTIIYVIRNTLYTIKILLVEISKPKKLVLKIG